MNHLFQQCQDLAKRFGVYRLGALTFFLGVLLPALFLSLRLRAIPSLESVRWEYPLELYAEPSPMLGGVRSDARFNDLREQYRAGFYERNGMFYSCYSVCSRAFLETFQGYWNSGLSALETSFRGVTGGDFLFRWETRESHTRVRPDAFRLLPGQSLLVFRFVPDPWEITEKSHPSLEVKISLPTSLKAKSSELVLLVKSAFEATLEQTFFRYFGAFSYQRLGERASAPEASKLEVQKIAEIRAVMQRELSAEVVRPEFFMEELPARAVIMGEQSTAFLLFQSVGAMWKNLKAGLQSPVVNEPEVYPLTPYVVRFLMAYYGFLIFALIVIVLWYFRGTKLLRIFSWKATPYCPE